MPRFRSTADNAAAAADWIRASCSTSSASFYPTPRMSISASSTVRVGMVMAVLPLNFPRTDVLMIHVGIGKRARSAEFRASPRKSGSRLAIF